MRLLLLLIAFMSIQPAFADDQVLELKPEIKPTPLAQSLPEQLKEQADKIAPQKREPVAMPQPDGQKWQQKAEPKWKTAAYYLPRQTKRATVYTWEQAKRAGRNVKYVCSEVQAFYNDPKATAKRWEGDGTLAVGQVGGIGAGILAGVSTTIFAAGR